MNKRIDPLTPEQRRYTMRQVHSENTKPEMLVRRLTHRMGYRYRLHRKDLPGKPDMVFLGRKKVIFVHGCFWHGHNCPAGQKIPKTNQDYWIKKLRRNQERDRKNQARLREAGWDVMIIWECETKDEASLSQRISQFLNDAKTDERR